MPWVCNTTMVMSVASKDFLKSAICNLHLLFLVFLGGGAVWKGEEQPTKRRGSKRSKEEDDQKSLCSFTYPKSPLMCENRPRFCKGYHLTASGWLGMLLMGTTTLPRKLLLLPVPLFLSFWILISKSPGNMEASGTTNSNCTQQPTKKPTKNWEVLDFS
jgi:hypothetical protein